MKYQLCFVIACGLIPFLDAAAVRVKIASNPYLYEIAQPSERFEALATPVHPVRGFQASPAENRERRIFVGGQPAGRSADLRSPLPRPGLNSEPLPAEPEVIRPYKIAYDSLDNNGTQMKREETKDEQGVVRGSYSYTDPLGIFRVVEYIADENGFRASIRTNEPGVGKAPNGGADPASVIYEIDPHPSAVAASRS